MVCLLIRCRRGAPLALLVDGEGVVFLQVAEGRLRTTKGMRRDRRALATRIDAELGRLVGQCSVHPGEVFPRFGL